MTIRALKMKLKPGCEAEYRRRHDELWPELAALLRQSGISDYSIFLDEETLTLFAVHKLAEDHTLADLPKQPIMRRWWESMSPLMETNPDHSPREVALKPVFHLA
ncbi:MAG: L-rhamnose mutarotase [Verrucomicrobia bacterium]|nr:L-rhamnose mutarotase [Verrucomicrobiota bacterium]